MRHPFFKMRCSARLIRRSATTFYLRERCQRKYDNANILKNGLFFLKKGVSDRDARLILRKRSNAGQCFAFHPFQESAPCC